MRLTYIAASSKETHAKQKAVAQERKASKPNADHLARSKKIWERLRRQSHVPLDERKNLVAELFSIITGRVKDFVLKHDGTRVIQTGIKYGNLQQRKTIANELKGSYVYLAQSKFAKFMIGKLLVHGDDEIRDLIVPEFYGNVRKMIKHPEAAWILDDTYRGKATPTQKAILLREWYGAEYALFKVRSETEVTADLSKLLEQHPEKRGPTLRYLFDMINRLIQKRTTAFTMLHDAMLQYYLNIGIDTDAGKEFVEVIKGDEESNLLQNLAYTKSGARLVCLLFAHGNAKDRKLLLRAYKGWMDKMAGDPNAYQVLLAALDVIDDTVLTAKAIYPELLPKTTDSSETISRSLLEYVEQQYARVPVLYPFSHKLSSILPVGSKDLMDEVHKIRNTTSKKDPDSRRRELAKAIAPQLLDFITSSAKELIQSYFGGQFISEVLIACSDAVIEPQARLKPLQAVVSAISDPEMQKIVSTPPCGRMLKSLVLSGHFNPKLKEVEVCQPPLGFADMLFEAMGAELISWATGDNSFIVLGMLESKDMSKREELVKLLKSRKKDLQEAAKADTSVEGSKGNKGTQLILDNIL